METKRTLSELINESNDIIAKLDAEAQELVKKGDEQSLFYARLDREEIRTQYLWQNAMRELYGERKGW